MNKVGRIVTAAACAVLGAAGISADAVGQPPVRVSAGGNSYVSGEVLVRFKPGTPMLARQGVVSSLGDRPAQMALGSGGLTLVKLKPGRSVDDAVATYRAMAEVESVQPNYIYRATAVPNDPSYSQLWGLKNTGQTVVGETYATSKVPGDDMNMESAWDLTGGDCGSVIVAVLDSGVNYTHEDLAANMWDGAAAGFPNHGANFVAGEDSLDPMPLDADGHGTHVAATIGAVGNNNLGVTGVCWKVQLMALRALTVDGGTTASIIGGLSFAVAHGAKVVNMSFGGPSPDPAFESEIINARANGVIAVAAAGNNAADNDNPTTPVYPCNFPEDNVICVAALDQGYNLANFSNVGKSSVDVGAPGTNVLSAWPGRTVTDDLTTGWSIPSGGWAEVVCLLGSTAFNLLVDPSGFCLPAPPAYAANANHIAFKPFDLSGTTHATVGFFRFIDTEPGQDFLGYAHGTAAGDPFAGNPGSISEESGSSGGFAVPKNIGLDDCLTASCTFGFRLRSNATTTANEFGVGILGFEINTTQPASAAYHVLNGTSMATPHVSGLAAMIMAHNPAYTDADVVNSVKFGGDAIAALQGNTVTGRAVDAMGSLKFINPPTNVSAVIVPP